MRTCPTLRRRRRGRELDWLFDLASVVDRALEPGADPFVFGTVPVGPDEIDLALHELPGPDPVAGLLCFEAPAGWSTFGMAVHGRAREPDPATSVRVVHVVSRSGRAVSLVTDEEQPAGAGPRSRSDPAAEGPLVDACRRVLALPTSPPPGSTADLWARLWLDRILVTAGAATPLGWPESAALHPAVTAIGDVEPGLAGLTAEHLVAAGNALARAFPWAGLRRGCTEGVWPVDGLTAEAAAWMDDGMFARWVLASLPDLPDLAAMVSELVPEAVARQVRSTLGAWGLDP